MFKKKSGKKGGTPHHLVVLDAVSMNLVRFQSRIFLSHLFQDIYSISTELTLFVRIRQIDALPFFFFLLIISSSSIAKRVACNKVANDVNSNDIILVYILDPQNSWWSLLLRVL